MNVHEPLLHDATPLVTAGQLFPQLPQFVTVVCRFVSQALAALPSQLPRLAPQAVQARLDPLVHAVVSYCRLVHVVQDVQARLDPLEQAVVSYWPVWHVVHAANARKERRRGGGGGGNPQIVKRNFISTHIMFESYYFPLPLFRNLCKSSPNGRSPSCR